MTGLPPHRLVVGMEVHAQLRTATKCFCACRVAFGEPPNTLTCPVCLGLPGALPVLNAAAVDQTIRCGLALRCDVAATSSWDRKSYFYADLPKGYQITQYEHPLCTGGKLVVDGAEGDVTVRVRRIHLEEDTGRLAHLADGASAASRSAHVDYNRAGVPLCEIVTEPDLTGAADASAFLAELRRILRYLDVSDADMEKGQMRCEPNVNVHVLLDDEWTPTPIVELKNLNSLAAVREAIEYERIRQVTELVASAKAGSLLESTPAKGPLPRSTRGWDDERKRTFPQREKEEAHEYRYFAEPDLPPVTDAAERASRLRERLPELPRARATRFRDEYGLDHADAAALTATRALADWYEEVATAAGDPGAAANWVRTDALREMRARGVSPAEFNVSAGELGSLVRAVLRCRVPREAAKTEVFPEMADTGRPWKEIVAERRLEAMPADDLASLVREVVAERPEIVASARSGKTQVLNVLLGEVVRRSRGTTNPAQVRELLEGMVLSDE